MRSRRREEEGDSSGAAAVSAGWRGSGGEAACSAVPGESRTALPAAARLRRLASPVAERGAMGASGAGSAASPCSALPRSAVSRTEPLAPLLPVLRLPAPRWGPGLLRGAERSKNKTNGGVLQQGNRACLICLLVLSLFSLRPV